MNVKAHLFCYCNALFGALILKSHELRPLNIDYKIIIADKPRRMNTKFSSYHLSITLHSVYKKALHTTTNYPHNKKWQYIVELFEEDSLVTRNNSEVAPTHQQNRLVRRNQKNWLEHFCTYSEVIFFNTAIKHVSGFYMILLLQLILPYLCLETVQVDCHSGNGKRTYGWQLISPMQAV